MDKFDMVKTSDGFVLDGIRYRTTSGGSGVASGPDQLVLLKPWQFAMEELDVIGTGQPRRMLEVGVFEGGSAMLWIQLLSLEQYVGVDRRDLQQLRMPQSVRDHPGFANIRFEGGVSQDDRAALGRVMAMFDGPVDVVIDDASHQYALSKATFEYLFPQLPEGGRYVIEDWNWAHAPGPWDAPDHGWHGRPSLANLILRVVLLAAEHRDLVARVDVHPNFVCVFRGSAALADDWRLEDSLHRRPLSEMI